MAMASPLYTGAIALLAGKVHPQSIDAIGLGVSDWGYSPGRLSGSKFPGKGEDGSEASLDVGVCVCVF